MPSLAKANPDRGRSTTFGRASVGQGRAVIPGGLNGPVFLPMLRGFVPGFVLDWIVSGGDARAALWPGAHSLSGAGDLAAANIGW